MSGLGAQPAEAVGLELDGVESLPLGMGTVLVRVVGRWRGQPPRGVVPVLMIGRADVQHRFPALPGAFGAAPAAVGAMLPFRAAFSIAAELEAGLVDAKLDVGFATVALPKPEPSQPAAGGEAQGDNVIDRAVLAERRAARADSELMRLRERLDELERGPSPRDGAIVMPPELVRRECELARALFKPSPVVIVRPPRQEPPPAEAPAEPRAPRPRPTRPWLRDALPSMARENPSGAARLMLDLLAAQALNIPGELDYDLELPEVGWHRIDIADGKAAVMALERPRRRRHVAFRLRADVPTLARLLAHGPPARPARSHAHVRATLRRRRALRSLGPLALGLADLARAEIWLDPGLLYCALGYAIEPAWTRGHSFCLAHEIDGPRGGTWFVQVEGVSRLAATQQPPASGPHATVRSSQAAFQRLLGGELPAPTDKPAVSGDLGVIAAFTRWMERAQGIGAAGVDERLAESP